MSRIRCDTLDGFRDKWRDHKSEQKQPYGFIKIEITICTYVRVLLLHIPKISRVRMYSETFPQVTSEEIMLARYSVKSRNPIQIVTQISQEYY